MLVPIITGGLSLLDIAERLSNLASGSKVLDKNLTAKQVFAPTGFINWFQSSFATSDTKTAVGTGVFGVLTGYIYKSRFNGSIYYEVQLNKQIEPDYDSSDVIFVKFSDIQIINTKTAGNNYLIWLLLLGFFLLNDSK